MASRGGEPCREKEFGPRWRSGRSPSTPVRCRRSTPLSPTTQPNLHISSHRCPPSSPRAGARKRRKAGLSAVGDRGALARRTCARRRADRRSASVLAARAALPSGACAFGGARWDYPSIDLRRRRTRLLRCVAMKTTRLLVLTLVLALCAAIAAGCGSSSGSGGDDDPAALIPAGAPVYVEGVVRPDGKVRSDLEGALKKILRTDDPGAKIQQLIDEQRQGRRRHLQGRRRAVARRPRRRRGHRAAQRPERRLRGRHRLHGRRQGRADAGQAEGRHRQALLQGRRLPLRRARTRRRRASSTTASWSAPRAA